MDLTLPYEVTSDQDVAAMFVIPVKETVDENDSVDFPRNGETEKQTRETQMETDGERTDKDPTFDPCDVIDSTDDGNSSEVNVLNIEPKDMESEDDSDTTNENEQKTQIDPAGPGESNSAESIYIAGSGKKHEKGQSKTIINSAQFGDKLQCPKCKRLFPIDADLTQHQCISEKDVQEVLSCAICQTSFENMEKLKEHMKKHWESLPYKCHVCSERYWTEKSLKRHLIKHETREKPFTCVECTAKYVHKRQLLLHMANAHSRDKAARKYPCEICGRNFLRKCDLTKHVKKCVDAEELLERENNSETSEFNGTTKEEPSLPSDRVANDGKLVNDSLQGPGPKSPDEVITSAQAVITDSKTEDKDSPKPENNTLIPGAAISPAQLMNILTSIQGSGIPAIIPFINTNGLAQNLASSPLLSMLPLLPVASLLGLNAMTAVPQTNPGESAGTHSIPDDKIQSPTLKIPSRRKIKQPRKTISKMLKELPTKPDMGEKLVDVAEIIRRNKKLIGDNQKVQDQKEGALYNCQICAKSFPTLPELQVHCANHGSTVFSCKYCKKVLSSQVSLYRHEADHEDNRPFKCDLCDKAFVLKAELNRHTDIQHSKRPFTCKICRFNFSCKANLDAHMPVHLEKRVCPFCPRSFTTETYLQRHLARHHDVVDPDALIFS